MPQTVLFRLEAARGFVDGLVNRLRIGSARLALDVRDSPAIYIAFDMLANSENLLGSPFRLRRKTLGECEDYYASGRLDNSSSSLI